MLLKLTNTVEFLGPHGNRVRLSRGLHDLDEGLQALAMDGGARFVDPETPDDVADPDATIDPVPGSEAWIVRNEEEDAALAAAESTANPPATADDADAAPSAKS